MPEEFGGKSIAILVVVALFFIAVVFIGFTTFNARYELSTLTVLLSAASDILTFHEAMLAFSAFIFFFVASREPLEKAAKYRLAGICIML
ncbi:MAG TPA: hypothetical protein VLX56_09105, partial [Nitrososphaerales archaeon]|nr:hypothetical protein [Nitrososphaerales archaeon]